MTQHGVLCQRLALIGSQVENTLEGLAGSKLVQVVIMGVVVVAVVGVSSTGSAESGPQVTISSASCYCIV